MKSAFDVYCEEFKSFGDTVTYRGGYKNKDGSGSYTHFSDYVSALNYAMSCKNSRNYFVYVDKIVTSCNYETKSQTRLYTEQYS